MAKNDKVAKSEEPCGLMVLQSDDSAALVGSTLKELGVGAFDLGQIRVPTGGGVAWTYETSKGPEVTRHMDVVIAMTVSNLRKFYREPFGEGEGGPPDCASNDGVTGYGINSLDKDAKPDFHECEKCPWSQFGSDRVTGKGKECSEYMQLYAFRLDSMLPDVIVVPPTSLKTVRKYVISLAGEGKRPWSVLTRLSLEPADRGGFKTSIIKPAVLRELTPAEVERMAQVVKVVVEHGSSTKK